MHRQKWHSLNRNAWHYETEITGTNRTEVTKKYYRKYIANLNRLKPDPDDNNPDWTLLQLAMAESEYKPIKPFAIFIHRLKYDYALTSKPFVAYQKKQNLKKLNVPVNVVKEETKPKAEKEWVRVPMPRNRPGPNKK